MAAMRARDLRAWKSYVVVVIGLVVDSAVDAALAARSGIDTEVVVMPGCERLRFDIAVDDVADALAFRAITDARVPEHAPFSVYALWLAYASDPGGVTESS